MFVTLWTKISSCRVGYTNLNPNLLPAQSEVLFTFSICEKKGSLFLGCLQNSLSLFFSHSKNKKTKQNNHFDCIVSLSVLCNSQGYF